MTSISNTMRDSIYIWEAIGLRARNLCAQYAPNERLVKISVTSSHLFSSRLRQVARAHGFRASVMALSLATNPHQLERQLLQFGSAVSSLKGNGANEFRFMTTEALTSAIEVIQRQSFEARCKHPDYIAYLRDRLHVRQRNAFESSAIGKTLIQKRPITLVKNRERFNLFIKLLMSLGYKMNQLEYYYDEQYLFNLVFAPEFLRRTKRMARDIIDGNAHVFEHNHHRRLLQKAEIMYIRHNKLKGYVTQQISKKSA